MESLLNMLAAASLAVSAAIIAAAGAALRNTTLVTAWLWALGAVVLWGGMAVWACVRPLAEESLVFGDQIWYAVALLSLCPAIAVLGARRPRARAWTWFVIFPMLAVLGWPALTVWGADLQPLPLKLEAPTLLGFLLVLLMGAGNYAGTRFWPSACLFAMALCLLVAPLSAASPAWLSSVATRAAASVALGLAAVMAHRQRSRLSHAPQPLDRLWEDYGDTFGIVWARRLQDRLNGIASQQSWPVELTPQGFSWQDSLSTEQRDVTAAKLEQSLRWMLRRFVDPEWIDQRLRES